MYNIFTKHCRLRSLSANQCGLNSKAGSVNGPIADHVIEECKLWKYEN